MLHQRRILGCPRLGSLITDRQAGGGSCGGGYSGQQSVGFLYTSHRPQTLQALVACPPMYHLMKSIPLYSKVQRPCTSTPMIDSL